MKVSMKGDYGVRALVELAHHYGEGQVQSAAIAARQSIPEPYLDQLLTTLRRAGFIRSVRGPQGGHALIRDPHDLAERGDRRAGGLAGADRLPGRPGGLSQDGRAAASSRSGRRSRPRRCACSTASRSPTWRNVSGPATRRAMPSRSAQCRRDTDQRIADSALDLIGNTPLVRLEPHRARRQRRDPRASWSRSTPAAASRTASPWR